MNELKPEARSLLAAARGAEALSHQDRARIKRGVLLQVAVVGASATVGGSAVAMSLAAKLTLVVSGVAVLGGGAVSVWAWQRSGPAPVEAIRPPSPPKSAKVATAKATPAAETVESPLAPPAPGRRDGAKVTPKRPSQVAEPVPEAPSGGTVGPLDPELRVLRLAQDDLRAGLPAQALRRLQDFERRFGAGSLGQERQAIAAIALCQAHPGPAARARADAFLRSTPESPLAVRVRSACEEGSSRVKELNENQRPREP